VRATLIDSTSDEYLQAVASEMEAEIQRNIQVEGTVFAVIEAGVSCAEAIMAFFLPMFFQTMAYRRREHAVTIAARQCEAARDRLAVHEAAKTAAVAQELYEAELNLGMLNGDTPVYPIIDIEPVEIDAGARGGEASNGDDTTCDTNYPSNPDGTSDTSNPASTSNPSNPSNPASTNNHNNPSNPASTSNPNNPSNPLDDTADVAAVSPGFDDDL
jgi:hypothetical protein